MSQLLQDTWLMSRANIRHPLSSEQPAACSFVRGMLEMETLKVFRCGMENVRRALQHAWAWLRNPASLVAGAYRALSPGKWPCQSRDFW